MDYYVRVHVNSLKHPGVNHHIYILIIKGGIPIKYGSCELYSSKVKLTGITKCMFFSSLDP